LSIYVLLCVSAGILSHFRLFPTSWQIVFLDEAVLRQLVPAISFFAVAWASKAYFRRRIRCGEAFAGERLILSLSLVVVPIIMILDDIHYEGDDTISTAIASYGAMINNIVIALFFLTGRLFYARGPSRIWTVGYFLAVAATTHFVQFRLTAACAFLMLLGVRPRLVIIALAVLLMSTYAVSMYDIPGAFAENPDKGIRVAFIADSFESLYDTNFLGIGYGTESVRWVYRFPGVADFTFMPNPKTVSEDRLLELLSRGVHNSFVQAMLRTGLPGGLLLVCGFFASFPPANIPRAAQAHASIMFIVIFIACFVNPALESPVQLVGIGFVYGYLLALRAYARGLRRVACGSNTIPLRWHRMTERKSNNAIGPTQPQIS
jgi:hypothetical protein